MLQVANFNGEDRREVISDNLPHPFGLSLLGNYLYWTDWQRRSIERVHKITGNDRKLIADLPDVMGLKAVHLGEYNGSNPCRYNNGNCTHLCLNRPGNNYVCACKIGEFICKLHSINHNFVVNIKQLILKYYFAGYELTSDLRTCVIPKAFLLFVRKENIGRISIENNNNVNNIPVTGIKDAW